MKKLKKLKKLKDVFETMDENLPLSKSEQRRQELKRIREQEEAEVFDEINRKKQPKTYKGRGPSSSSLGMDPQSGPVNRGKKWYSK